VTLLSTVHNPASAGFFISCRPNQEREEMHESSASTFASAAVKAAPAVGSAAWAYWGPILQGASAVLAITYSSLMITFLLIDRLTKNRRKHANHHP